jgi:hypothetical protein
MPRRGVERNVSVMVRCRYSPAIISTPSTSANSDVRPTCATARTTTTEAGAEPLAKAPLTPITMMACAISSR